MIEIEVRSSGSLPVRFAWLDTTSASVWANLSIAVGRWCMEHRPKDGVAVIIRRVKSEESASKLRNYDIDTAPSG